MFYYVYTCEYVVYACQLPKYIKKKHTISVPNELTVPSVKQKTYENKKNEEPFSLLNILW